jgi:hypothetical protein
MAEREHIVELRRAAPGYEADYAAWLEHQVSLLKADRWSEVDKENLIDEVESLGRSDFKAFVSAFEILLAHMLKWDFQPERRSRSWQGSILEHRQRIADELEDSPSYSSRIEEAVARAYRTAVARAVAETDLPRNSFPAACPYSWDEIMNREHEMAG